MTAVHANSKHEIVDQMIRLRVLVGFLGEKRQANWWDCGFLDSTGTKFLQSTFPRTFFSAAIRSSTEAARIVHDAQIGRVGVFHLFRFPVDLEDRIEAHISSLSSSDAGSNALQWDGALDELRRFAESQLDAPTGPVQIGIPTKILTRASISELAAHYYSAFKKGFKCFPYFASQCNGRH
jgi:hypothetical protein